MEGKKEGRKEGREEGRGFCEANIVSYVGMNVSEQLWEWANDLSLSLRRACRNLNERQMETKTMG